MRILLLMVLLGAVNLYVLYYRRGTSLPDLLRAAEAGRQLVPGLEGPPGTPPRMKGQRAERREPLRGEFLRVAEITAAEDDTLEEVLRASGVPGRTITAVQDSLRAVTDVQLHPGQSLVLYFDLEDRLQALDWQKAEALGFRVERAPGLGAGGADAWAPVKQDQPIERRQAVVSGTVRKDGELTDAIQRAGEERALAGLLSEALAGELDLPQEARAGDRFSLLVEKVYHGRTFYRYGRLLAFRYEGAGASRVKAALYTPEGGEPGYYTERGESLQRALRRSPLRLRRETATARPVLHLDRGRLGLGADYPAPPGTPVVALFAGRITFRGPRGPLGNTVVLSQGSYEATYSPLGRLARLPDGAPARQTVRAGQVIGYVAAGKAPHPHLHLGLRQNGRLLDPIKHRAGRLPSLPADKRTALLPLFNQLDTAGALAKR